MDMTPEISTTTLAKDATARNHKNILTGKLRFPQFKHEKHGPVVNVNEVADEKLTIGQRIADKVAATVGSWPFIIIQSIILAIWLILNTLAFIHGWDPYPFILLNLMLSFQAAYAAPFVMMSQNRQSEKDRLTAQNDYQTDCKGEEEIRHIMEHLDHQDALILQIVQQLQAQNEYMETQHQQIISALSKVDPALLQQLPASVQQEVEEQK